MIFFGAFFLLFGILVIIFPELIAYIIGFFLISLGVNMLLLGVRIRSIHSQNKSSDKKIFSFGNYEFVKRK